MSKFLTFVAALVIGLGTAYVVVHAFMDEEAQEERCRRLGGQWIVDHYGGTACVASPSGWQP